MPWSPAPSSNAGAASSRPRARVDALRDVGRLLLDRDDVAAGQVVEAVVGLGVADVPRPVAHDRREVDVRRACVISPSDHTRPVVVAVSQATRACGSCADDRVEDRVADLVAHLVGVAFGDRLGREQIVRGVDDAHWASKFAAEPTMGRPDIPEVRTYRLRSRRAAADSGTHAARPARSSPAGSNPKTWPRNDSCASSERRMAGAPRKPWPSPSNAGRRTGSVRPRAATMPRPAPAARPGRRGPAGPGPGSGSGRGNGSGERSRYSVAASGIRRRPGGRGSATRTCACRAPAPRGRRRRSRLIPAANMSRNASAESVV